jgi:type II secretory pathway pseudopilin PulG
MNRSFVFRFARNFIAIALVLLALPLVSIAAPRAMTDTKRPLERPASMINELNNDAIFYLRLPNLIAGFSGDGRRTDRAYQSDAHQKIIARLQDQIMRFAKPMLRDQVGIAELALLHLNGPIEIAIQGTGGMASPASSLIVRLPIRPISRSAISQLLSKGLAEPGDLEFSKDGIATMSPMADMGLRYELTNNDQLLTIKLQAKAFEQVPSPYQGAAGKSLAMITTRAKRLEPSDTGFVMVARISAFLPILKTTMPNDEGTHRMIDALSQIDTIAIGAGNHTAKSKTSKTIGGALSMEIDLSPRVMKLLPAQAMRFDAPTLGTPNSMFSLQLPTQKQARAVLDAVARLMSDENHQVNLAIDKLPINPLEIFDVIGPSVVAYDDEGGTALAFELRNPAAWGQFVSKLQDAMKGSLLTLNQRPFTARGEAYTAVDLRSILADDDLTATETPTPEEKAIIEETIGVTTDVDTLDTELTGLIDMLGNQRSGLGVYRISGNWLLWSDIPQPLFGRKAGKAPLVNWLTKTQQQDFSTTLMAASGSSRHHAKLGYHLYLSALQNLADLLGTDIAIEDMPSARELKIPDIGAIGFSVDRTDTGLAFRVHYQNSPAELIGSSGATTVAVVAILAAIAIPAYQDYLARAQVSEAYFAARALQLELAEIYAEHSELPNHFESTAVPPASVDTLSLEDGVITVRFGDGNPQLSGKSLRLVACKPDSADAELTWRCGNQECDNGDLVPNAPIDNNMIADKHLPPMCR